MELTTTYFETVGRVNTDEVFRIVRKRAQELGIKTVLVASTGGGTAVKAVELLNGVKIIAVRLSAGWRPPTNHAPPRKFTEENRSKVESAGGIVLTATHFFGGLDRAVKAGAPGMYLPSDIVANTLRLFGSGMKVVCEIGIMAADAGLVGTDEDVIAIAGTGRGADTAVVFRPVNSDNFFSLRIKELLCKPYNPVPPSRPATPDGAPTIVVLPQNEARY